MRMIQLTHGNLGAESLGADLAKSLADKIPPGQPDELVDTLHTLAAQGAALAASHGLQGPGEIEMTPDQVHVLTPDHAIAQPLDVAAVKARAAARAAEAAAAQRAAARKKVADVAQTVKGVASKVAAAIGIKPGAPPGGGKAPASRPTTPPPRRT